MEAIVLKAIPYQEKHRIVTLFTKTEGLVRVMVRSSPSSHLQMMLSPLTHGEFHLKKGAKDFYYYQDASLLDPFLEIRADFDRLMTAGKMCQAVLKTQYPDKPAPQLFSLLRSYLCKMKGVDLVEPLRLSFHMKVLLHEGVYLEQSDQFSQEEWGIIEILTFSKVFEPLLTLTYPSDFPKKIDRLFAEYLLQN